MKHENQSMNKQHSSFIPHRLSFSSGFTLIEVIMVVVIIMITIGVAVPTFSGRSGSIKMKDAVRSVVRISRYARSMAILEQTDCTLDFAANQISLTSALSTNTVSTNRVVLAQRQFDKDIRISDFENLADSGLEERSVMFYASGMNDGFELTLEDDENRRHTILCNPITGKVTVDED